MTADLLATSTIVDPKLDITISHMAASHVSVTICFGGSVIPGGGSSIVTVMPITIGCGIILPAAACGTTSVDARVVRQG